MQKNVPTTASRRNKLGPYNNEHAQEEGTQEVSPPRLKHLMPTVLILAMIAAILFLDAVLPLGGLWFNTSLLPQLGSWSLLPTHLLFPGWAVSSTITSVKPSPPDVLLSWQQVPILLLAFVLLFLLYLFALRRLPKLINQHRCRFILYSTLLFGGFYILFPVVTSPDIFSYISYARMGVLYHLNPLTTLPTAISTDPSYVHVYWNTQPSAYGPVWAAISCALQWLTLNFGTQALSPMVLALRLLGLAMHLCSVLLIWSIIGCIQALQGQISTYKRTLATLAFAWNPLLLFEACVNAHNDATLLVFVLLAIRLLLPGRRSEEREDVKGKVSLSRVPTRGTPEYKANLGSSIEGESLSRVPARGTPTMDELPQGAAWSMVGVPLAGTLMLALATCLKVNIVVLMPFVLIFLWKQSSQSARFKQIVLAASVYIGVIVLLYAPFWQGGAILNILHTNPTTSRNINTLVEFLSRLYNSVITNLGFPQPPQNGSLAEGLTHTLSIGGFVVVYAWFCWWALRTSSALRTLPSLLRWLAGIWLLYCFMGTPWFWPWYLVTFFGLYALIEGTHAEQEMMLGNIRLHLAIPLLALSMLSLYCFYAWGMFDSFIPGLPEFRWAYLRGLWIWLIPLLGAYLPRGLFRKLKPYQ